MDPRSCVGRVGHRAVLPSWVDSSQRRPAATLDGARPALTAAPLPESSDHGAWVRPPDSTGSVRSTPRRTGVTRRGRGHRHDRGVQTDKSTIARHRGPTSPERRRAPRAPTRALAQACVVGVQGSSDVDLWATHDLPEVMDWSRRRCACGSGLRRRPWSAGPRRRASRHGAEAKSSERGDGELMSASVHFDASWWSVSSTPTRWSPPSSPVPRGQPVGG
jgi:hypothetical protein